MSTVSMTVATTARRELPFTDVPPAADTSGSADSRTREIRQAESASAAGTDVSVEARSGKRTTARSTDRCWALKHGYCSRNVTPFPFAFPGRTAVWLADLDSRRVEDAQLVARLVRGPSP